MIANDVSGRDLQIRRGGQWLKGEGIDGTRPLGAGIVTKGEVSDASELDIQCELNGQLAQKGNTRDMIFPLARLVAEPSLGPTLIPDDIFITGNPSGAGFVRKPSLLLKEGDMVVVRISRIGDLRNIVIGGALAQHCTFPSGGQ